MAGGGGQGGERRVFFGVTQEAQLSRDGARGAFPRVVQAQLTRVWRRRGGHTAMSCQQPAGGFRRGPWRWGP